MRTVIVDGDILIYRASEAIEDEFETVLAEDDDFLYRITSYGNKQAAIKAMEQIITKICKDTKSSEFVVCLTDKENFRKKLNPDYKSNRKKNIKPLLFYFLRDWLSNSGFKIFERPSLEADDVMGILATSDKIIKGDKCIWSFDKDFKTIPCKFAKGNPDGTLQKYIISQAEADWWFMYQTLIGDRVDGYYGCPNVGDKRAKKLLGEIGEKTLAEMWKIVVEQYNKQGLTEETALLNARMARILHNTDYNFKEKQIILWRPPQS